MTKVKICGLTREADIEAVNRYLPDYIGFVFAGFSKRYIQPDRARVLRDMLSPEIRAVGVFVDESVEAVASLISDGIIDIAQLHGHEDEDYIRSLRRAVGSEPIIKVFNMNKIEDTGIIDESSADYVMLDSGYGTGRVFDWSGIRRVSRPFFLAGGLTPENVGEAVQAVHPYAVDISSGVETDGVKDEKKIRDFVAYARGAM